jgi:hypothetical protein
MTGKVAEEKVEGDEAEGATGTSRSECRAIAGRIINQSRY